MTRLKTADITQIGTTIHRYEEDLMAKTGCDLIGMACLGAGISQTRFKQRATALSVGLVPVTMGQGVISGFCEAVSSILSYVGGWVFIAEKEDVAGITESVERGADIVMLADDDRFVAIHLNRGRIVDNSIATGKVFVEGLNQMGGDLKGRPVLVIGCGPVGQSAAETLANKEARVRLYDVEHSRCRDLKATLETSMKTEICIVDDPAAALHETDLILDASPAKNMIKADHITPHTYISAPGIPLGLDPVALVKIENRLLHDPLQLGVATMLAMALCTNEAKRAVNGDRC